MVGSGGARGGALVATGVGEGATERPERVHRSGEEKVKGYLTI